MKWQKKQTWEIILLFTVSISFFPDLRISTGRRLFPKFKSYCGDKYSSMLIDVKAKIPLVPPL